MSSLLEAAIVDAKALKEAALKNAETLLVEKYAQEVKNTMDTLLEQENPLGLPDGAMDPALGAPLDPNLRNVGESDEEKVEHLDSVQVNSLMLFYMKMTKRLS